MLLHFLLPMLKPMYMVGVGGRQEVEHCSECHTWISVEGGGL